MQHADITQKIIGCAYKVYNTLGFGFLEKVYENALALELHRAGLKVEQQKPIRVWYEGSIVGDFEADLLVEDLIIVEVKSVENLLKLHEVQLVNYLTATRLDVGLLLNFSPHGVEVKRKYREFKRQD